MRLNFITDKAELIEGINILSRELNYEVSEEGIKVYVYEASAGKLEVAMDKGIGSIGYKDKIHFFRGMGLFIEALKASSDFRIEEEPQFDKNGAMFDVSRNGVLKVDSIKRILRKMAVMGLNLFMLYTEDIYKIKGASYFGYMRGAYTKEELRECDDYAYALGIEMVPCIQTLAHIEQFLKWNSIKNIKDTRDVLLVGNEETYKFIDEMIASASAPFRSRRIHIGMDEAFGMGRGKYLDVNGFRNRFEIISGHLKRVVEITEKYGLSPMIWSDMYFMLGSKNGQYYDLDSEIDEEVRREIPEELKLVYWDYYHEAEEFYASFIKKHQLLGHDMVFAGGAWTWLGIGTNYGLSFITSNNALKACKSQGVREVFITIWGDDGTENNFFSALPELQLYAEHGYQKVLDIDKLKNRVKFCTGIDFEAYMDLKYLDEIPGVIKDNAYFDGAPSNPSKFLLWQDILLGLFDKHIEGLEVNNHYLELEAKLRKYRETYGELLFNVPEKLCSVLGIKGELGLKIKKAYDDKNLIELKEIQDRVLPELLKRVGELREAHRRQWFEVNKPFGFEVIDIRYGGVMARIMSTMERLKDFIEGKVDRLEELEVERLYFDGRVRPNEAYNLGCSYQYYRIASPGAFFHSIEL